MDNAQLKTMECLERFVGTWAGQGIGEYPTIATFHYREEFTLTPVEGKAYLHYDQRTWRMDQSGKEVPSHWESGFWRVLSNNEVELLCAQASGRLEVARGQFKTTQDGLILNLNSSLFANDARVEQSWREFELRGDTLRYSMKMQTNAVPALTMHVQAQLERSRAP